MISRARLAELFRFGLASVASAAVTLGVPVLLHEGFSVSPPVAVAIAYVLAFGMNFLVQRHFVFRSAGRAGGEVLRYTLTSIVFRSAEYVAFLALFKLGMVYFVAQLIVVGVSFVIKFVTLRRLVYGRDTPADGGS